MRLRDDVHSIWMVTDAAAPTSGLEWRLPDGLSQIVISLTGEPLRVFREGDLTTPIVSSPAVVCGPGTRPIAIEAACRRGVLGVVFEPGGAYPFIGPALQALHDAHVPLEALWPGPRVRELVERLALATPEQRHGLVAAALCERLSRGLAVHPALRQAVALLAQADDGLTVGALADAVGVSSRHLNSRFRHEVGLAPKAFARVRRFQRTLAGIDTARRHGWAALAARVGYVDQAHLIHDFRAFAGLTPAAYLRHDPRERNHINFTQDAGPHPNQARRGP